MSLQWKVINIKATKDHQRLMPKNIQDGYILFIGWAFWAVYLIFAKRWIFFLNFWKFQEECARAPNDIVCNSPENQIVYNSIFIGFGVIIFSSFIAIILVAKKIFVVLVMLFSFQILNSFQIFPDENNFNDRKRKTHWPFKWTLNAGFLLSYPNCSIEVMVTWMSLEKANLVDGVWR